MCPVTVWLKKYNSIKSKLKKKNLTDFGSCNTSAVMVQSVCLNVPPLGDEPFITTAFIRPGLLINRWELCLMGRRDCIRAAATFHFKPDLPVVQLHLPPTKPLLMHHYHSEAQAGRAAPLSQPNNQPTTQAVAAPTPHYSKGLSPPIFSHFLGKTTRLSFC